MVSIWFFWTPKFAADILSSIISCETVNILYVVTQTDKPTGRHAIMTESPVKMLAQEHGIPVFTPETFRNNETIIQELQAFPVDFLVVVAYGKILPRSVLELPKILPMNIHGSLLPKYRWASPIQSSLLHGELETGVTLIHMTEGMDEGDILATKTISIEDDETSDSLLEKFSRITPDFLIKTLLEISEGRNSPIPQDHTKATYCKKITKDDGRIDWNQSALKIYQQFQAYTSWPGVWCMYEWKRLKLLKIRYSQEVIDSETPPGTIIPRNEKRFVVCKHGMLEIEWIQKEWSRPMEAKIFFSKNKSHLLE